MKYKIFLGIGLLVTILCFFCTGLIYCLIFYLSYDPILVRNICHFYSGMFLVFAFTLICISEKIKSIKTIDILWGVVGTLVLTIAWEIVYQGTSRYYHGQGFYVQWNQVASDILGIISASIIWMIKRRKFLLKNRNFFIPLASNLERGRGEAN